MCEGFVALVIPFSPKRDQVRIAEFFDASRREKWRQCDSPEKLHWIPKQTDGLSMLQWKKGLKAFVSKLFHQRNSREDTGRGRKSG